MRVLGSFAAALVLVLLTLLAPGAVEAATWSASETISSPGEENKPADVAVSPDGTVIAVWQRANCTGSSEMHQCKDGRVQYSVRPPGGGFSEPVDMPGDPFEANIANPKVAVDGVGNAIAVWNSGAGETSRLRYSLRPVGGVFGDAVTISDPVGGFHNFPSIAMAADGRAVITFFRRAEGADRASYSVREPGGAFSAAQSMVGDPGTIVNQAPEVHLGGDGEAIANWASQSVGVHLRYAVLPAGGSEFGSTQTIENGSGARLAMAPSGAAALIWKLSGSADDLRYSFRPPGGLFAPPQTLPESEGPLGPRVAIAADGTTVAAWSSLTLSGTFARWATAPFGEHFGAPTPLAPGGPAGINDLEMSDRGIALALWVEQSGLPFETHASLRPPGGIFGEATLLAGPTPQGAALSGGVAGFSRGGAYAAALWSGRDLEGAESHDVPLVGAFLDATEAVGQPVSASAGPVISGLEVMPRRFRVSRAVTALVSRRGGTMIRFRLSEPATVRFQVERRLPGVRVKVAGRTRCLPATPRNRRRSVRGSRCVRFKRVGAPLTRRNLPGGPNRVAFSGRIGKRALRPGPHRIVAVALDKAGEASQPRRTGFTVLRPKRTQSRDKTS